jgi:methionyl-tRNA formyltransferase
LRGASPIHHAILSEEKTGITIMQMDEGMDTGDILLIEEVDIQNTTTFTSLYNDLTKIGARLVLQAIDLIFKNQIKPIKQDNSKATYAKILNKSDGKIDWLKPSIDIEKQVRAFEVFPGTYFFYKEDLIKVIKARVISGSNLQKYKAGTIINTNELQIVCGDGNLLQIDFLQKQGKKPLFYSEFKKGNIFDLFYHIL